MLLKKRTISFAVIALLIACGGGFLSVTYTLARGKITKNMNALESGVNALRAKEAPRQPLFASSPEGDGGPEILAAAKEAAGLAKDDFFLNLPSILDEKADKAKIDAARPFLKASLPLIHRVRGAVRMKKVVLQFNFQQESEMPSPCVFQALGIAMIMHARDFIEKVNDYEAMQWLLSAARFGQDISRKTPLRYRSAGANITIDALRECFRLLYRRSLELDNLKYFLKIAEAIEASEPDFADNLLAERYRSEYRIYNASKSLGFLPSFSSAPETGILMFTTLYSYASSWEKIGPWYQTGIRIAGRPYPESRDMTAEHIRTRLLGDSVLRAASWDYAQVFHDHLVSLTFCRAARFLLWLHIFRAENGRYPYESIEELFKFQPQDPFTPGQKFYYVYGFGIETIFYSVGSDATHNNGEGSNWVDRQDADIVFPVHPLYSRKKAGY